VNFTTSGNGWYQSPTIPPLTEQIVGSGNENGFHATAGRNRLSCAVSYFLRNSLPAAILVPAVAICLNSLFNSPATSNHCVRGIYIFLAFKWHIKHRNWLRIEEEKIYLCERLIALYKYRKGIVWIALQTNIKFVKHAIKFGLFNIPSTSNHCA